MSENEANRIKFWSPLRVVSTLVLFALLAAFGVSSCNSNDVSSGKPATANRSTAPGVNPGFVTLPRPIMEAENRGAKGDPIKLSDYSGKVVLVNLWATWCGPCRSEIPELVKLNKEYHDRGVEMIGLSTEDPDASAESVSNFVREYKVDYHVGWATREVALTLMRGQTNIPQSFIIARDGRIVRRFIGFRADLTPAQIKQALEEALKS